MNRELSHRRNTASVYDPVSDLRREMERLFDDFWGTAGDQNLSSMQSGWQPFCDVDEAQDHYLLSMDMPGVPKDQIKIEVVDRQLLVSGERKNEQKKNEKGHYYSERRYGKFQRSFALPTGVDVSKIDANYADGVLQILVPKAETAKPRQIKISEGGGSGWFSKLLGQTKKEEGQTASNDSKFTQIAG